MTLDQNIEKLLLHNIDSAAYVIDDSAKVIAFNNEGANYLPTVSNGSQFFELFEEEAVKIVETVFLEAKNFNKVIKDEVNLSGELNQNNYLVGVTPLKIDDANIFLITLSKQTKDSVQSGIDKFQIYTSDIDKIIDDADLLAIIEKIKSSYPFTFIGKSKFQREIDKLGHPFWIKENNGNFTIVNQAFADNLGLKISQIEGSNEKDLLPKYLSKLYSTIDAYVIDTSNTVIVERVASSSAGDGKDKNEILEFPITDIDNNVVAIVGTSMLKKESQVINHDKAIFKDVILKSPEAMLIIDHAGKILYYSTKVMRLFRKWDERELVNSKLTKYFSPEVNQVVEQFKMDSKSDSIVIQLKNLTQEPDYSDFELHITKIYDDAKKFSGMSILIEDIKEQILKTTAKYDMYETILKTSPEAMFIYNTENLKFLEVNEAALKLYGYSRKDFLNMDLTDLYAPEDIQTLLKSSKDKTSQGQFTGPWRHKKKDGSSIIVELNRSDIEFQSNKSHLNIVRDVSDKIETEKKLQLFKASYENTSDLIINTDRDGFVTFANAAVIRTIGLSQKDLEKKSFLSLVADDDRAKVNSEIFHSGENKPQSLLIEIKKQDGNLLDAELTATPIIDYSGEIDSFSLIIKIQQDIQPEIESQVDKAKSKIDAPFLSNVFHELLTPINVIIGFVHELTDSISKPTDDQKEAAEIIHENQKLLLQLMDNAVEYSHLEQGEVELNISSMVFPDIVEEIRENVKKTAASNEVEFTYGKISSSLSFESDKQRLATLLTLFMKFAIEITKENKVYMSAYLFDKNHFIVSVKDGRSSISQLLIKGMKEIFSSDEDNVRRNYGFSRFTVKLAQKLVQLLSGDNEVIMKSGNPVEYGLIFPVKLESKTIHAEKPESIVIKGEEIPVEVKQMAPIPDKVPEGANIVQDTSSINVNVNVQTPDKDAEKIEEAANLKKEHVGIQKKDESLKEVSETPSVKKEIDVTQLSCLSVEDQVDSQILFKVQMKDLKSIEFAPSFEKALPLIKSKRFDFIVMDINLQGEYNGLDALRVIQKMPGYQEIPVIAVTAYVLPGDREKFIAAGFSDFISKPVLRDKLMECLPRIFNK